MKWKSKPFRGTSIIQILSVKKLKNFESQMLTFASVFEKFFDSYGLTWYKKMVWVVTEITLVERFYQYAYQA